MKNRWRAWLVGILAALGLVASMFMAVTPALASAETSPPPTDQCLYFTDNAGQGLDPIDEGHNNQPKLVAAGLTNDPTCWYVENVDTIGGVKYFQLEDTLPGLCLDEGTGEPTAESCPVDNAGELLSVVGTNGNELEFKADSKVITSAAVTAGDALTLSSTVTASTENQWLWSGSNQVEKILPVDFTTSGSSSTDWSTIAKSNPPGDIEDAIAEVCDSNGDGDCGGQITSKNTSWDSVFSSMHSNDVTPLFYIATGYGGSDVTGGYSIADYNLATIEAEVTTIEGYYGTYDIGFMFDLSQGAASDTCYLTTTTTTTCQDYYQDLWDYINTNGAGDENYETPVMFNFGNWPTASYIFVGDGEGYDAEILQVYEGTEADIANAGGTNVPTWVTEASYPTSLFSATVFASGSTADAEADVATLEDDGIGNVYITNGTGGNPYNGLPSTSGMLAGELATSGAYQPAYGAGDCGPAGGQPSGGGGITCYGGGIFGPRHEKKG